MFLSCDPGLHGCVMAFEDDGIYISHFRTPTVEKDGNPIVKKRVDPVEFEQELMHRYGLPDIHSKKGNVVVYLEHPTPMGSNGFLIIASLFDSIGATRTVFETMGCRVIFIHPNEWKKSFNLIKKKGETVAKNKKRSREVAQIIVPELGHIMAKDTDVAEAALIGIYGNKHIKPTLRGV